MPDNRRFLSILAIVSIVVFFSIGVRNAASTVKGGMHDFASGSGGWQYMTLQSQVCVFCHTPHNANTNQTYTDNPTSGGNSGSLQGKFLWNRRVPLASSFTPYSSDTFTGGTPGTTSLLCLSCHDGIGGINVLLNYPNGDPSIPSNNGMGDADQIGDFGLGDPNNSPLNIGGADCSGDSCSGGGDLQNDHPIGFTYVAGTGLKTITDPALMKRMQLTGNKVECNTCHDPHMTNPNGGVKNQFLVTGDNAGSKLCFGCHDK